MKQPKRKQRQLPDKLLIGYANNCDEKVSFAIQNGVNVVVWAFLELGFRENDNDNNSKELVPKTSLDFQQVQNLIQKVDRQQQEQKLSNDEDNDHDTIHLISFGGWNGPHLETRNITPEQWYDAWKHYAGDIFDGIDWDLEGHDSLDSPTNEFSIECLDFVGRISQLAKADGYIIGMAPPQSYLDIHDPHFSRRVNLTEPDRPWHDEFHYFGANVYSYLLSKYGDSIDFVSVQFYESYSRAAMEVFHYGKSPSVYLESYVQDLVSKDQSFPVNFENDPTLQYSSRQVSFPLSKLVFGFANGWAKESGGKTLYIEPEQILMAYKNLLEAGIPPRGFMYWVITEEGTNGVKYTSALNEILKIRQIPESTVPKDEEL